MTLFFAVPITVGTSIAPSLQPIRDLEIGTERVAVGDYSRRLPVVQDDDLGALVGSFNRMRAGLAERERLQAAFGSYVDPDLAVRLLAEGDDVFTGERLEVTVLFVDIRDFTPFAEATPPKTPSPISTPSSRSWFPPSSMRAATPTSTSVTAPSPSSAPPPRSPATPMLRSPLRCGSSTLSPSASLERSGSASGSTPARSSPGPSVEGKARVHLDRRHGQHRRPGGAAHQATGDAILLTRDTRDALAAPRSDLIDRGAHDLRGKAARVHVFALNASSATTDRTP